MSRVKDKLGQRFGGWTVLEFAGKRPGTSEALWKCRCDCGNIRTVRAGSLVTGHSKSCGCSRKGPRKSPEYYTHDGKSQTDLGWAECLGLSRTTVKQYISNGLTIDEIIYRREHRFDNIHRPSKLYWCNDTEQTMNGWSECIGISETALRQRMARGQTLGDIIKDRSKERIVITIGGGE